jgi:lipid II:glycine glycyltransferase (peptidoglycan interpeptide bridge formation enzyme)
MIEAVNGNNLKEYKDFVERHENVHFMHFYEWGRVKKSWKWEALLCRDSEGKAMGSAAVLIRKIPFLPYTLMYACRGLVCDSHDFQTMSELFSGLCALAKKYKSYILKLDSEIANEDFEFKENLERLGFKKSSSNKDLRFVQQPNNVYRLNLEGLDEHSLLEHFEPKTRYNIRYAMRKGVEIRVCGKEMLPAFCTLMKETALRDHFIPRSPEYFGTILDEMGDKVRLFIAFWENEPIAGTLAVKYGKKVRYLYGASSNRHRNVMPNYLIQFNMIKWAMDEGCTIYDFGGIASDGADTDSLDNPLYGLYRFKKGFNGYHCEFSGEFDYVFYPFVYRALNIAHVVYKKAMKALYVLSHINKYFSFKKNLTGRHEAW